jgi:hypothetical protein
VRRKHRNDRKHVPGGFQAGNARYERTKPGRKMGKHRVSWVYKGIVAG